MRAGAHALSLLSVPLNAQVLRALEEEPTPLTDLRRAAGSPPQTTMRKHLRTLTEAGIIERRRQTEFPGFVDYELAGPGEELAVVAAVLQAWLQTAPEGPLSLGSSAAKSVVKALVDGWSSTMVRALAARPLSLTELNRLINSLNYPSLERRLGAMRLAGQVEACPNGGRGTPYAVTEWMRRAVAPLAAAARWERRNLPDDTSPITKIDIESAFLLAIPLLRLPSELSGACRLVVEIRNGAEDRLAGVIVEVEQGRVVSCVSRLQGEATAWASGSAAAWLDAVIEGDVDWLEVGGDCALVLTILDGLNGALVGAGQRA